MSVTLQQLRDLYYDILREEQEPAWGTSAYPLSLADVHINSAELNIESGRVIHPTNGSEVRSWEIHYLKEEAFYANVSSTSLTTDTIVWDVVVMADTTWFPNSGAIYIWGNVITYTSITPTGFYGCTGIKFAHVAWTQIDYLHALPADYNNVINVTYKNKVKVTQKQFDDVFEDLNNYKWTLQNRGNATGYLEQPQQVAPFYVIKDAQYLIMYNYTDAGAMIKLRYNILTPEMVNPSDLCSIDNDTYAKTTIPYLAVAETLLDRWEEERGILIYSRSMAKIKQMYDFYNNTDAEKISWVHYRMAKGKINI